MKAKKKPIADKSAADYGVDLTPRLKILKTTEPPGRKAGVKVKDVAELVVEAQERSRGALMATLSIAEHDNASLKDATNKALTAAPRSARDVHVLVAGAARTPRPPPTPPPRSPASRRCCSPTAPPTPTTSPSRWPR